MERREAGIALSERASIKSFTIKSELCTVYQHSATHTMDGGLCTEKVSSVNGVLLNDLPDRIEAASAAGAGIFYAHAGGIESQSQWGGVGVAQCGKLAESMRVGGLARPGSSTTFVLLRTTKPHFHSNHRSPRFPLHV